MNFIFQLFCFLFGLLISFRCWANDGVAAIGLGGLELNHSDKVSMKQETLRIRPGKIQVDYLFKNESKEDSNLLVMFPLPKLGPDDFGTMGQIQEDSLSPEKSLNFQLTIDGHPYQATTQIHAFLGKSVQLADKSWKEQETDITQKLTTLGLPLYPNPNSEALGIAIRKLPTFNQNQLIEEEILQSKTLHPRWYIKITFFWEYVFPAQKTVHVSHTYHPFMGHHIDFLHDKDPTDPAITHFQKEFCTILKNPNQFISQRKHSQETEGMIDVDVIDYILKTATTWKGPIGDFRLILENTRDSLMMLCAPNLHFQKTGPRTFEAKQKNYVPTYDLHIGILHHTPVQ